MLLIFIVHIIVGHWLSNPDVGKFFSYLIRRSPSIINIKQLRTSSSPSFVSFVYCQTPTPGETWELTLLSRGNKKNKKKNKKKKNDPHLNSPRRDCARILKFCMRPSVTKRIRLHPKKNLKMKSVPNCLKWREI